KTDGTDAGTVMVKDLDPGSGSSTPANFTSFNGKLYFKTSGNVNALWKSDGTNAGTIKVNDAVIGQGTFNDIKTGPNKIFFTYNGYKAGYPSTATGAEPWVSDGTDAGTVLLKDINTRNSTSNPYSFCKIGNIIYFKASDGITGNELWKTDGTEAGTVLVKDIRLGTGNSDPVYLTNLNGILYFSATDGTSGLELWKSDGTTAGTVLVKDIYTGATASSINSLTVFNNTLYFSALSSGVGRELWKSDGTEAGTVIVKDIVTGALNSNPNKLTVSNGILFFTAQNGSNTDEELWKTDGTDAGTVRVKDIYPGTTGSIPNQLTNFNNKLYFSATDNTEGNELWTSDGTDAGTVLFKSLVTGTNSGSPKNFKVINNTLYFGGGGPGGVAIWKSDGTTAGTTVVKYTSSNGSTFPAEFTLSNNQIFFTAIANGLEKELWKTDGTDAGTVLVKDILPGSLSSNVEFLTDFKGTLYFKARGDVARKELWKSDGTEAGTVSMDLNTIEGSDPYELTVVGDMMIFTANDFYKGFEMWKIVNSSTPLNLLNFTAQKDKQRVILNWETSNEINTSHFEIERSVNSSFTKIGDIPALNSAGEHNYKMYDEHPEKGVNFYRLKMIDIDGHFTYSVIRRIVFNNPEQMYISPNPASNEIKISNVDSYHLLQVIDASGRTVLLKKLTGSEEIIDIKKLIPGVYVLRLTGDNNQKSLPFVKQ
ncbi:MAG TPA: T9SS type A sorting domain-containing protein, partial [Ferruginibacter sp.]|nr:T9SS type A sorting domain-containing protein [Ferruginibacter sp.]